jgi:hypothetical protein
MMARWSLGADGACVDNNASGTQIFPSASAAYALLHPSNLTTENEACASNGSIDPKCQGQNTEFQELFAFFLLC